jgi:RNA polymerase sigma-70 factor (ECF subfamily)
VSERGDDAELVLAARGGNRAAFGRLYDRFAPMAHGILLARVPRREVEDLVHDVFIKALQRLGSLRDPGAFGPWLAAIARNRATDFHRHSRPHEELPDDVPSGEAGPDQAARLLVLLQALPVAYRETLVLRLVEGMTGPEIAERTGLSPGSVRVNLHRAMKLLRQRLGWSAEDA